MGTPAGTGGVGGQVVVNDIIPPGTTAATGKLTVLSNATISAIGTNAMKLNKGTATNDVLSVTGILTYGGTLSLRSEEHTSELQSLRHLVCPLMLCNTKLICILH